MEPLSVDGYSPAWLQAEKRMGVRSALNGTVGEMRAQYQSNKDKLGQMITKDMSVETKDDVFNDVPVRIYTPQDASGKELPVGVFFHGGGYVLGDLDSEDETCRLLAKHTPCIIVSVDYRLAPEFKQPIMLEDCVEAYRSAWSKALQLGGDQSRVFIIGTSAGGGLALTVTDALISSGEGDKVRSVIALVPVTAHPETIPAGYSAQYTAYEENARGVPVLSAATMYTAFEAAGIEPGDGSTFVTLSQNLASFPPTYICTCGKDPLRDDGRVLELMLAKAGVKIKSDLYDGMPHFWWANPLITERENFFDNVVEAVKWGLQK